MTGQTPARPGEAPRPTNEETGLQLPGGWPLTAFDLSPWSHPLAPLRAFAPLARQIDELMAHSRAAAPAMAVARTAVDVRETPEAFEFVADVRRGTLALLLPD